MSRPERSMQDGSARVQVTQPMQQSPQGLPQNNQLPSAGGIREDIRALNSSILLVTQKIKYLVRNEKILGRNLVVLNKKIRTLEEKVVSSPQLSEEGGVTSIEVESLKQQVALLEAQLEDMRLRTATSEQLKELKYIIDSINPLEFATLSQVRDLIDKKMKEQKK